jgi:hypothetical protein
VIFLAASGIFVAWRFASPRVDLAELSGTATAEGIKTNPAAYPLVHLPDTATPIARNPFFDGRKSPHGCAEPIAERYSSAAPNTESGAFLTVKFFLDISGLGLVI